MGNWSRAFKITVLLVAVIACVVVFRVLKVRPEPYEASDFQPGLPPPPADVPAPAPTDTQTKPVASALGTCVPGEERTENGIIFVRICPGTFMMGSADNDPQAYGDEKPAHQVTLSEFWIGKTEVTNQQYRRFRSDHQGEAELPATGVSWNDANAACESFGGRLPTEAEWEYAARSGSRTAWSFGDDGKRLGEYAWYSENSAKTSHPVGIKAPNAWGLYDMHGNVWEWVADWYATYPATTQPDPTGPAKGEDRVLRGGAYHNSPRDLRSACRLWDRPVFRRGNVGFRCARSSPPGSAPAVRPGAPKR